MSRKLIDIHDKVHALDNKVGGLRGEVIFGRGKHYVRYKDPFGRDAIRTEFDEILYRDENIVPIGGYQFAFDKLFNIGLDEDTTLRVGDLNDEAPQMKIGVQRSDYKSIHYNAECSVTDGSVSVNPGVRISALNYIFGFMIGDGGATNDPMTAIAPNYKDRCLYHPIPFRMSNDGTGIPQGKYFGKIESFQSNANTEPITSYYVKLFDDPKPRIVHVWASNNNKESNIVDDTVFSSTSSLPIESYTEINLSVSAEDGRGFFTSTQTTPGINEFALISGWYNPVLNDYEAMRMFTHFTRPTIALDTDDSIEALYRLYAR